MDKRKSPEKVKEKPSAMEVRNAIDVLAKKCVLRDMTAEAAARIVIDRAYHLDLIHRRPTKRDPTAPEYEIRIGEYTICKPLEGIFAIRYWISRFARPNLRPEYRLRYNKETLAMISFSAIESRVIFVALGLHLIRRDTVVLWGDAAGSRKWHSFRIR